jgi:acyl-CoA thioesterase I
MQPLLDDGDLVLFQGDSITDAGRDYLNPNHLGYGYSLMASAWFQALYPEKQVRFLNRGISGNRAIDLAERWQEDCLDLRPTWISLLIGINDTWRRYDQNDPTSLEAYETTYRSLLQKSIVDLPTGCATRFISAVIWLESILLDWMWLPKGKDQSPVGNGLQSSID